MEGWLSRLYRARRRQWIWLMLLLPFMVVGAWAIPVGAILAARYFGLSVGEFWGTLGLIELVGLAAVAAGLALTRSEWLPLAAWVRQPPAASNAVETLYLRALNLSRRFAAALGGCGLIAGVPAIVAILSARTDDTQALTVVLMIVSSSVIVGYAAAMGFFAWDLFLRPLRVDLARHSARHREAEVPQTPLGLKLVAGFLALTVTSAFLAGSIVAEPGSTEEGAARAILVSVAITALLAASLGSFIALGVLAPVRDLIRGARAVQDGDLTTEVPVTTTDEIGDLAFAFNEMVTDLRARTEDLQASQARLVASADAARRQVERDLHDGAQQNLVLLNLKLGQAARLIAGDDPRSAEALLDEARADLQRALAELRDLAHGIYPQVLTSDGLPGALAEVADQAPISVDLSLDGARRYPPELEAAVYFCCLEALQNAAKHAGGGAQATITLNHSDGSLFFEVADDGGGFDADGSASSAGLQNMADRIGALGGKLNVESAPGAGTKVTGTVPVEG